MLPPAVKFTVLPPTLANEVPPNDAEVVIEPVVVSDVVPVLFVSLPVMTMSALPALIMMLPAVLCMKLMPIGRSASIVWEFVVNAPSTFWYS